MRVLATVAVMREGEIGYTHADSFFWVHDSPVLRAEALVAFEHPAYGKYVSAAIGYHETGSYADDWIEVRRDAAGYAVTIPDWSRDHEFRRVGEAYEATVDVVALRDETSEPVVMWMREE